MSDLDRAMDLWEATPAGRRFAGEDRRAPLRDGLSRHGHYDAHQSAGRFYPVACVALEITQRCNLDCSLCYLSEAAEVAKDVPLPVLLSRIAMIESHYGPGTNIQITGGDPTLARPELLERLCREIRACAMRSCLMTNGIRATRELLGRLASAGLDDVAFHVDLTQERKGYTTEIALNDVRRAYLARARGLGLRVLFNTTVFEGNFRELPDLAQFFRDNAAEIALTSFQMQADTGRGTVRVRPHMITQQSVTDAIADGMGCPLDFDAAGVGHPDCNKYASVVVAGPEAVSALSNKRLAGDVFTGLSAVEPRRDAYLDVGSSLTRLALLRPILGLRLLFHGLGLLWQLRRSLFKSRCRVHRMAILVHNFMAADDLQADRCESCVFMVATADGPLSMCAHNAARDLYIFAPERIETVDGIRYWSAATGAYARTPDRSDPAAVPPKLMKGRQRQDALKTPAQSASKFPRNKFSHDFTDQSQRTRTS